MAFKLGYCALRWKEPDLEPGLEALKAAGWDIGEDNKGKGKQQANKGKQKPRNAKQTQTNKLPQPKCHK